MHSKNKSEMGEEIPLIEVSNLQKSFKVLKKRPGLSGAIISLFSPEYKFIEAVKGVSFNINKGEIVGYLGPNGAGKSTTIKMLSGILYPGSGSIRVSGLDPFGNKKKYVMRLGVMFGQRTQLWWDLPVSESFDLLKEIYKVDEKIYQSNLDFFNEILDLKSFWSQPVRRLSLGQRVRADLAAALIHDPDVLFLDEPTIGLDVLAREQFRNLIKKVNKEKKTTILITSHDLGDIETVVNRLILIDEGLVLFDGSLRDFMKKYSHHSRLQVRFRHVPEISKLPEGVKILEHKSSHVELEINISRVSYPKLFQLLPQWGEIKDFHMQSSSLEDVLTRLYKE